MAQSNKELELKLDRGQQQQLRLRQHQQLPHRVQLRERRSAPVDTIHNHRNTLAQEVIYEVGAEEAEAEEAGAGSELSR